MTPAELFEHNKAWAKQTIIYVLANNPDGSLIDNQDRARPRTESIFDQMLAKVEAETVGQKEMRPIALTVRVLDWVVDNHKKTEEGL
ncbi:MAG TPA: hypothetical protein VGJ05_05435 [Fimbriiglobus sp.]|jgi:hypothetical protein